MKNTSPQHVLITSLPTNMQIQNETAIQESIQIQNQKPTTITEQDLCAKRISITDELILQQYLTDYCYEDGFSIDLDLHDIRIQNKSSNDNYLTVDELATESSLVTVMVRVLEGFLKNQPAKITQIMELRNVLVTPLQLRTSSLGCPVSSLLDTNNTNIFANKYPVLASRIQPNHVQVLLGADDKHLRFRSCVSVKMNRHDTHKQEDTVTVSLCTRVTTKNLFGRLYMFLINPIHTRYIEPTMLRNAVAYACQKP